MSTAGLRKVDNYESVLAQAIKDESHVDWIINPYLANAANRIINNPELQRVKDRLEDDLTKQTRNHIEEKTFETHVHGLAVEAKINRSDLDYIISDLHQPPLRPPRRRPKATQRLPEHLSSQNWMAWLRQERCNLDGRCWHLLTQEIWQHRL